MRSAGEGGEKESEGKGPEYSIRFKLEEDKVNRMDKGLFGVKRTKATRGCEKNRV